MKTARHTMLLWAVITSLGSAQFPPIPAPSPPRWVCGHWVVRKVVPTSNIQASPNKAFLGVRATYLPSKMQFGRRVCVDHPLYRLERISRAEFSQHERIDASELGINGKSVLEVTVLDRRGKDVDDVGTYIEVVSRDRMVTVWNGVSYELDRVGPPCKR